MDATMTLELTEREGRDLRTALAIRLVGMREELVHTDDREYRAGLKATIEQLEVIQARLERLLAGNAS
jgi:hypothetical protein